MNEDNIGDVCSEDIDGDGIKNPLGLVDDTGNINYSVLLKHKSEDLTPLGEDTRENLYFIKVTQLDNDLPTLVKFELTSQEAPLSVERDFGDLTKGKGVKTQHVYSAPGVMSVLAKVTTKSGKVFLVTQQLFLGQPEREAYGLTIKEVKIDSAKKQATFTPEFQGKFDYFQRENTANGHRENTVSDAPFTTSLEEKLRNNITLKGYVQEKLVAVASLDVLDQSGTFLSFNPVFSPLLKSTASRISTTLKLHNLSFSALDTIKWDFGDGRNFIDKKLIQYHTYTTPGKRILIQKIRLKTGKELIATSSMTLRAPEQIGNQVVNILPAYNEKGELSLRLQPL